MHFEANFDLRAARIFVRYLYCLCSCSRRAWKDPSDAQNVPVRTLVLVRHGAYDGQTGSLTNIGIMVILLTHL